jgi:NAD(P)-dependent dehydrogenase (short-subunit alcohol dehydrogenase family)
MTDNDFHSPTTALITGGTSGMGLETARLLLRAGGRVAITGRDTERLAAAQADLGGGDRVLGIAADAADPEALDTTIAEVAERFGRLDLLFANAGVAAFQPAGEVTDAEFDRIVGINFKGVYFTIQKALPLLADGSAIIVNASWTLHRGMAGATLYSATKAAVHSLARTLAAELAPRRIRVNSVSPGYIATPMFHDNVADDAHNDIRSAIPAARFGTAEDVAAAVVFLASPAASYINGQDLVIDGGLVGASSGVRV